MSGLRSDLRYAVRVFRAHPGISLVALVSFALGIGVSSTIFSLVDGMYLRPLPVRDPSGLVWVSSLSSEGRHSGLAWRDYLEVKKAPGIFSDAAVQNRRGGRIESPGEPETVLVTVVSDNYFPMLGVAASRGRLFEAGEGSSPAADGGLAMAVSDSLWRRRFSSDPALVGKSVRMNGRPFTVVGILPPGFQGLDRSLQNDVWVPVRTWRAIGNQKEFEERGSGQFEVLGRLQGGVALDQARSRLEALDGLLRKENPEAYRNRRLAAATEAERQNRRGTNPGTLLLAIVGLVVLIACSNVAILLLALRETRHREISIRLAVGASPGRLARQLLAEAALLALAGTALALLLSGWMIPLLPALLPPGPGFTHYDIRLDLRVLTVSLLTGVASVLLAGASPALGILQVDLMETLRGRESDRKAGRLGRSLLVAGQSALSVVLFTAAALLAQSFLHSSRQPLGLDRNKDVLVLFGIDQGPRDRVYSNAEEAVRRLGALPGVRRAAFCRRSPFGSSGSGAVREVVLPDRATSADDGLMRLRYNQVSRDYLDTLGIRVLSGRPFSEADMNAGARVVQINRTMARQFWPSGDALDRYILVDKVRTRIVGVVEDGVIGKIHEAPEPFLLFPFSQAPVNEVTFLVETAQKPDALLSSVQAELRSAHPNLALLMSGTLQQQLHDALYGDRIPAVLAAAIGVLGMFLAAAGLFGVVLQGVQRRMRETAVRMALGALPKDILWLVLRRGLLLAGSGAAAGAVASLACGRLMSGLLHGVEAHDPLALGLGIAAVLLMAVAASLYPAWKAMRADPGELLRAEA